MSDVYVCIYISKQAGKTRGVWGGALPGNVSLSQEIFRN